MDDERWITTSAERFTMECPADWEQLDGIEGMPLAVAGATRDSGFRPSLTVAVQSAETAVDDAVRASFEHLKALELDAYLLDFEPDDERTRALLTFRAGPLDLTVEQWYWTTPETLVVVTATAENTCYAVDAPLFEHMLMSLETR